MTELVLFMFLVLLGGSLVAGKIYGIANAQVVDFDTWLAFGTFIAYAISAVIQYFVPIEI
ncbi:MAG: hypothetical protein NTX14_03125 [Candidatus Nealsonbacteria bacterium]|nr:hypothetical protein [Candidatus Nealsonbacteria bacterium]